MTAIQDDNPTSGKRKRRKIRFHERVQFKTIRHVSEFSDDEIRNGWYDKDDFNRMSDNVSDIAKLISDGETSLNGEDLCTRGLEHIVEEELADYRAEKMINSIDAVLDEQEEQWDEGKEEPGLIAELYAEYAKPLLREAHLIGLKDAEQGYKNWDDLLDEKEYQKLTANRNLSPSLKSVDGAGKTKKTKKAILGKKEKTATAKRNVKKNKVKKYVDAPQSNSNTVRKTEKDKKVKRSSLQKNQEKGKDKNPTPRTWNTSSSCVDESSVSSAVSSTSSHFSSPPSSSRLLKKQSSISSINSCTLRDLSLGSGSEEFDTIGVSSELTKNNTMSLKSKQSLSLQRNVKGNNSLSPKKKTNPRRSATLRKHGTELSPFVFRRDGTLTFRKPDVEKIKREQKDKRKSHILGSLTKFCYDDDDEVDILAGILSKSR